MVAPLCFLVLFGFIVLVLYQSAKAKPDHENGNCEPTGNGGKPGASEQGPDSGSNASKPLRSIKSAANRDPRRLNA